MESITLQPNLTFESVWAMFQDVAQRFKETDKKFQDTDKKFQDTDRKFKETERVLSEKFLETDKKFQEIHNELGGIGKSNGEIAEEFFFTALDNALQVGKLKFDYIDRKLHRKRNNSEAEYDIILYNNYKVLVVEIKYNFRIDHLHGFYTKQLKRFRTLFPEYSAYKLYGAVAGLVFEAGAIEEAEKYGFYILSQNNDRMKLLNPDDFSPNEIK